MRRVTATAWQCQGSQIKAVVTIRDRKWRRRADDRDTLING